MHCVTPSSVYCSTTQNMVTINCSECNTSFDIYISWVGRRKTCSRECAKQLAKRRSGEKSPMYGKKLSEEHKEKLRMAKLGLRDEDTNRWSGDKIGYRGIHHWIQRKLGKAVRCSNNPNHKSTRYYWANKSGEYKRDVEDWQELCPSCNHLDGVKIHPRFREESGSYHI